MVLLFEAHFFSLTSYISGVSFAVYKDFALYKTICRNESEIVVVLIES